LILFNIHIFVFLFSIRIFVILTTRAIAVILITVFFAVILIIVLFDIFLIEPVTKQIFDIDIIGFLITGLIFGFLITVIFNTVRFVVIITVRLLTVLFAVFLTVPVKVRFVFFDITGFFSTVLIGFLITGPIFGFLITVIFNTGRLLNVLFAEFLKVPVKEILFGIIGFLLNLLFAVFLTVPVKVRIFFFDIIELFFVIACCRKLPSIIFFIERHK